ncbi:MAG: hypothetical protein WCP21_17795 [Armatimonadota bacterium]
MARRLAFLALAVAAACLTSLPGWGQSPPVIADGTYKGVGTLVSKTATASFPLHCVIQGTQVNIR